MTDPIWRVRGRWSTEGTFLIQAPTPQAARDHLKAMEATGELTLADCEPGTRIEYFSSFRTYNTDKPGNKPIPEGITIFVMPPSNEVASARMRLRERYGAPNQNRAGVAG